MFREFGKRCSKLEFDYDNTNEELCKVGRTTPLHTQVSATLEEKEKGLEELEADVSAFSRSIMVMSFTIDIILQTN